MMVSVIHKLSLEQVGESFWDMLCFSSYPRATKHALVTFPFSVSFSVHIWCTDMVFCPLSVTSSLTSYFFHLSGSFNFASTTVMSSNFDPVSSTSSGFFMYHSLASAFQSTHLIWFVSLFWYWDSFHTSLWLFHLDWWCLLFSNHHLWKIYSKLLTSLEEA